MAFHVPNEYRIKKGKLASPDAAGNNGGFLVPVPPKNIKVRVIASDGEGWQHVSVSLPKRTPTWEEMCYIKNLFWDQEDCVVQYHPPKAEYVNNHPHTLHLWRPNEATFPLPDSMLVGIKDDSTFKSVDDIIYATLGMLSKEEEEHRTSLAHAMQKHGGNFVAKLGELITSSDRTNYYKLKRTFANYFSDYEEFIEEEEHDGDE